MTTGPNDFFYSNKYQDDEYEYRHVHVTKEVAKLIPKNRLMSESEWRSLGIQQSPGWVHYMIHGPERHVSPFVNTLHSIPIVHVTKEVAKLIPKNKLMSESEWRSLGIQESPGWVHYMIHGPERHVLLFRRQLPKKNTGGGAHKGHNVVGVRG